MKPTNHLPSLRAAMSRRLRRGRGLPGSYRLAIAACASVLVPMGVLLSVKAASFYWTGDAPGGAANWSTTLGGSNWSSSPSTLLDPQIVPTSSDDVFFVFSPENPSPCTTVLGADFSIKGLTFNAAAITPVTIGGANTLTVGTNGITVNVGSAPNEISANVKVGAAESWANNAVAATTFKVSGTISGTSALTLQGTGSVGTASGSFVFTHANTYSGALTLRNANTSLTLSGNGTLQSASSITLNGGTNLTLDNSTTVASRLGGTVPVISNGGTVTLVGSATSPVADTIGVLTAGSGATNINVTPDLNTPQATMLTINGLVRNQGGTVNFGSGGTISLPGQPAGLIGPWATIGDGENSPTATGTLEFATVSGGNVTALGAHNTGDISTWGAADNVQVNATQTAAGDQTIGTLYMTTAGILNLNAHTLTISSGGVIANGGTGTYIVNGNQTMKAASVLGGSGFSSATSLRIAGSTIKAAPGVPAFIFNIAGTSAIDRSTGTNTSTGVLQVNASLADNPQVVTGSFTSTTVNASNIVTLTSGTTGGIFPGATVTGLAGETGTQVVTSIIDATHFTVGVNAGAAAGSGTPVFTDHTGLTKTGGGILDLANGNVAGDGNAFAGFITINAGVVLVRADTDFGVVPSTAVPNFITLNGGEIRSTAGFTINASRGITIGPQGGTLNYDGGGTFSATSKITGPGGMTFESVSNSGATTFNLSATSGFLSYQGPTTLVTKTGSNITLPTPQEFPSNTPLTIANYQGAFGTVNFNNTAQTVGSLASDTGVGTITNINGLTIGGTAASPVSLTASYNGTISGTDLTKNGGGTQTLSRANTYSGTTTINGGTLLVTNTSGSATGTSNVVVASGGTLGGSGMITGAVTVNNGGTIAPATSANSPSTLQLLGGLTVSAGSSFNLELGTPNDPGPGLILVPTSDNIFVNGVATFSTGIVTINVTDIGIPASVLTGTPATYQFITTNSAAPNIAGVTFHINESPQYVATVVSDDANQSLDLVISQNPNPSLSWIGSPSAGNGPWNTTALAWINTPPGSGAAKYQDGALLTFDNTPGTNAAITLASNVAPGSMTFANGGAITYTFSGAGQITGSTGFTTNGLGTVNFNNHNTFSGAATINAGAVVVGAAGTLADASYAIASGASLTVNGTLTGANAAIGNAGTFAVNSGGSVAATTTLANAGTANFSNTSQTLASLSGAGPVNLTGTALTLRGGTYDGVLTGTGASSLTIAANTVTLSNGGNNYGNTTITGGTLAVTNASGSATGTGLVDIKSSGTLTGNGFITGDVTVESGGTLAPGVTTNGVTSGTLTFNNVFVNGGAKVAVGVGTVTSAVATNALTLQAGAPITLILNPSPGAGAGIFPVFTSAGLVNNNANTFTIVPTGVLSSPEVTGLNADINGNEIDVTISVSATPLFYTGANGATGAAAWDFVTQNWSFNGSPAGYLNGMNVVLDDTHNASGNNNIAVATGINPGSLTITGTQSYTFSGAGFGGTTGLVINSSGTITLGTGSTFTGATSMTGGGTVVIPNDTALGAAPVSPVPDQLTIGGSTLKFAAGVASGTAGNFSLAKNRGLTLSGNATLDISAVKFTFTTAGTSQLGAETAVVYNGVISGTGNLTIIGSGGGLPVNGAPAAQSILDLGVPQTYLGDTTINNAIVQVGSGPSGANNTVVLNVLPTTTTLNLINNGTFNVDSVASTLTVAGLNGDSTGRYGTTNASNSGRLTLIGSGNYNFAGTIGAMEVAGKNGADTQVSLVKTGTGTQTLSGSNTYTGVTTVSGGNLVVTGSISGSAVTVSGTGIISGTGTIGAVTIQSGGAIEPGGINALGAGVGGTLNSGNFNLQTGSAFNLAIAGGGPGIAVAGQLNVSGAASLSGGNFADAPLGLTPADVGDIFLIIVDGSSPVSGFFGNDPGNGIIDLADGSEFQIYYDVDPATMTTPNTGNDVAVQLLVLPIPEPGSLASVLSGFGMLAGLQRFRRRS